MLHNCKQKRINVVTAYSIWNNLKIRTNQNQSWLAISACVVLRFQSNWSIKPNHWSSAVNAKPLQNSKIFEWAEISDVTKKTS